jgi:transposase
MAYIKSYPNQTYLIPPKITDLFSKNHVCYLINKIAGNLDYSEFDQKYAGAGHPAYHPRINLKLLMMANVDGMRSSRRMAKNAQENVVYIYLAEKTQPDFRTISDFRKSNKKLVKNAFKQIVKFAHKQGLIDLSHLMIDGTKIKANASDEKNISKDALEKLDKYIDKIIEEGIKVDEEEDKLYGDRDFHQMPEDLNDKDKTDRVVREIVDEINKSMKEGKKEKLKEIKSELQTIKQIIEEKGQNKYSFTDPDSRFMKNKKKQYELGYNPQIVTDKNGLIISNDVIQRADDRGQLVPNIRRVEQNFGKLPEGTIISADNHYNKGEDVEILEKEGFDIHSPAYGMNKELKNRFDKVNFEYDEEKDEFICPEGKTLKKSCITFNKQQQRYLTLYRASYKDCMGCEYKLKCCKKAKSKSITAVPGYKALERIKEKMQTKEGKATYNLRKHTVETAFGDIKHNKKFREFLLRGIKKVKTEWDLVCIASNLVKINNLLIRRNLASC